VSLEPAQDVTLQAASGERLRVVVSEVDESAVTLVLTVRQDGGHPIVHAGEAVIEWTSVRGVHHVLGTLTSDPARPEVVRLHRSADERIQRRDAVRVAAVLPVELTTVEGRPRRGETTTLNVSTAGILLRAPFLLEPGTLVDLRLELAPGSPPLELRGRVVRTGAQTGVGIDRIETADETRLMRFVTERERLAARLRRHG